MNKGLKYDLFGYLECYTLQSTSTNLNRMLVNGWLVTLSLVIGHCVFNAHLRLIHIHGRLRIEITTCKLYRINLEHAMDI